MIGVAIIVLYIGGWMLYAAGEWVVDALNEDEAVPTLTPRQERHRMFPEDAYWEGKEDAAEWRERYYGFEEE